MSERPDKRRSGGIVYTNSAPPTFIFRLLSRHQITFVWSVRHPDRIKNPQKQKDPRTLLSLTNPKLNKKREESAFFFPQTIMLHWRQNHHQNVLLYFRFSHLFLHKLHRLVGVHQAVSFKDSAEEDSTLKNKTWLVKLTQNLKRSWF